jgi:phosphodiesterase/alkaline phosphatase D-like protein
MYINKNIIAGALAVLVMGGLVVLAVVTDRPTENVPVHQPPVTTPNQPEPAPKTPDAPLVTTSVGVTASNSTAAVTGTVNPNGAATSYWFEYGETTALGNRTAVQSIGAGYGAISAPGYITGLKANTFYYFRLSAKNQFATVNGATYTFQTNNIAPGPTVPPVVTTKSATNIARTTATINGQVNPNSSPTNYWFEYGLETSFGMTTTVQYIGSGSSVTQAYANLTGLLPERKYYFRINAQNQYGTINGQIMSFTTPGPGNPVAITADTTSASSVNRTTATLNGRINPGNGETTYWFEYGTNQLLLASIVSKTEERVLPAGGDTRSVQIDVKNLAPNTKYFVRLVARNSVGTIYGDTVTFTTKR